MTCSHVVLVEKVAWFARNLSQYFPIYHACIKYTEVVIFALWIKDKIFRPGNSWWIRLLKLRWLTGGSNWKFNGVWCGFWKKLIKVQQFAAIYLLYYLCLQNNVEFIITVCKLVAIVEKLSHYFSSSPYLPNLYSYTRKTPLWKMNICDWKISLDWYLALSPFIIKHGW